MRKTISHFAAAMLLASAVAAAEEADENALTTHTELSYIDTQGNSDTSSFALEAKAKKGWDVHKVRMVVAAYYSEDEGVQSKDKWMSELNYDYAFNRRLSFNYLFGYVNDQFSGYDFQLYTGPGAIYRPIDTKAHKLALQANVLYAVDDKEDYVDPVTLANVYGPIDRYASWKAGLDYGWQVMDNVKFTQELTVRGSLEKAENYFAMSKTALATKINGNLSWGVSYKVDYVNLPPEGKEYTDRTFMTSLIIDY